MSSKKDHRRNLENISRVLRQFGITDPGLITDTLSDAPLPTLAELDKLLKGLSLRLPSNISTKFVAELLLAGVSEDSPATLKWRERFGKAPDLSAIRTGRTDASRYHKSIFQTLNGIFDDTLSNGRIEQEINTGIHRVDIMFDNFATKGFFTEVRKRLGLPSNYVPVECKNYKDDLNSPEYDQVSGRLNDEIGRIGILVFRKIADRAKALAHCRAKWEKKELIIMLDDADILQLYDARHAGHPEDVDKLLWQKVRKLQLNAPK